MLCGLAGVCDIYGWDALANTFVTILSVTSNKVNKQQTVPLQLEDLSVR